MRGIKRVEAQSGGTPRLRLPITPPIMRLIQGVWSASASQSETKLIWAACCCFFFGFLHARGNMTIPDDSSYDPTVHLSVGDVAIDNPHHPMFLRVTIKQSKTDPFRKGVDYWSHRYRPLSGCRRVKLHGVQGCTAGAAIRFFRWLFSDEEEICRISACCPRSGRR